tara:strand:+ start:2296 stop:4134 length:1839 start_codon:yes stop_codon:yes gene_type:complete
MNILQIEDTLKGIPDEVLMQEGQAPSGSVPQYLVISEIQRRTDMRERYAAEQEQPDSTVSDQIVNKGIMSLGDPSAAPLAMNGQSPMTQQAMPQQAMAQQPIAQVPITEQQVAPTQMMNVGGEVMLDELISPINKIPEDGERDLYMAEFGDSVLSGFPSSMNVGQGSVPNSIMEDANKFRPEQMLDITPEELAVLQGAEADLPEVLNYAGGGIVELQEGRQVPEEEEDGTAWDWAKENIDPVSAALLVSPILGSRLIAGGRIGIAALRSGIIPKGLQALRGSKPYKDIMEVIGRSRGAAAGARAEAARTGARKGPGWQPTVPAGQGSIPMTQIGEQFLGRSLPYMNPRRRQFWTRTLPMGVGAYGLTGGAGDDAEAEAAAAGTDDTRPPPIITSPQVTEGDDQGPEPGSLDWIKQEQLALYRSGGGEREEKLQDILSRQREQGALREEQARSDMVTSALMNLGAGIAAGDPSEGLRLAANAVEDIRSAAREGSIAQQNMMDELELAGIDANQAEQVATLASMADLEKLKQQAIQLNNTAVTNAMTLIDAQAVSLSQQSLAGGTGVITQVDLYDRIARAYQLAMADPNNTNAYLGELLKPAGGSNGEFAITED